MWQAVRHQSFKRLFFPCVVGIKDTTELRYKSKSHLPFSWVDRDGSGLVQPLGNDNISERAVQPGHFNHIKALISPVNISCKSKPTGTQQQGPLHVLAWKSASESDVELAITRPAIQSTVMPSTLPMPLVTTSSLQVWSRLALLMVLRPMSTQ